MVDSHQGLSETVGIRDVGHNDKLNPGKIRRKNPL
jgi:hypothetical protein